MKKNLQIKKLQKGQALITLLLFVVVAVTIISASVIIIVLNTNSSTKIQEGEIAYMVAESGVENAILRLLRDPTYKGETLYVGSPSGSIATPSATVQVSGGNPYIILSQGQEGNFVRKVQATVNWVNNVLSIQTWRVIY